MRSADLADRVLSTRPHPDDAQFMAAMLLIGTALAEQKFDAAIDSLVATRKAARTVNMQWNMRDRKHCSALRFKKPAELNDTGMWKTYD